jgi:hypothetical protein
MDMRPVHAAFVQEVSSNIPHDGGFTTNPHATVAVWEGKLLHRLLEFSPDPRCRTAVM